MFLQSFGYTCSDPLRTLQSARAMLTDDGFILLTRTQPIRYALERAECMGLLGEEYFRRGVYSYPSSWNNQITLTKNAYTMSDLLNVISAAGLWIETTLEPQLSDDAEAATPDTSRRGRQVPRYPDLRASPAIRSLGIQDPRIPRSPRPWGSREPAVRTVLNVPAGCG